MQFAASHFYVTKITDAVTAWPENHRQCTRTYKWSTMGMCAISTNPGSPKRKPAGGNNWCTHSDGFSTRPITDSKGAQPEFRRT